MPRHFCFESQGCLVFGNDAQRHANKGAQQIAKHRLVSLYWYYLGYWIMWYGFCNHFEYRRDQWRETEEDDHDVSEEADWPKQGNSSFRHIIDCSPTNSVMVVLWDRCGGRNCHGPSPLSSFRIVHSRYTVVSQNSILLGHFQCFWVASYFVICQGETGNLGCNWRVSPRTKLIGHWDYIKCENMYLSPLPPLQDPKWHFLE